MTPKANSTPLGTRDRQIKTTVICQGTFTRIWKEVKEEGREGRREEERHRVEMEGRGQRREGEKERTEKKPANIKYW